MKLLEELALNMGKSLVNSPEFVRVKIEQNSTKTLLVLYSTKDDENCQLIGQNAILAKSIRNILKAAGKNHYNLDVFVLVGPRVITDNVDLGSKSAENPPT